VLRTRRLGRSGLVVGEIGLGCMGMSWAYGPAERDDDTSIAVIRRALDLGVTLVDTADLYGPWHNEQLVGRALAGRRDEVVLASKCGLVVVDPSSGAIHPDGRPMHIRMACDASLRRLGVDTIDLYQLHRADPTVPVAESIGAMADLVAAGKVRAIGVSELEVDQLDEAMAVHPITSVQSELSLWTRDVLAHVLPWCVAHDVAFIPFAPLGRGFLTGALDGVAFAPTDSRTRNPRFTTDARTANQVIVDEVLTVAERLGCTPGQVAIAWTMAQGEQVVPIPGTKRLAYLEENVGAAQVVLDDDALRALAALPTPVGSRY
jgi:aryl-alcohol dehydrogenase-like predicted oxidoreductase